MPALNSNPDSLSFQQQIQWAILWIKQLKGRTSSGGGSGTTPGIDSVLAQDQEFTAHRRVTAAGFNFYIVNPDNVIVQDNSSNQWFLLNTGHSIALGDVSDSIDGTKLNIDNDSGTILLKAGTFVLNVSEENTSEDTLYNSVVQSFQDGHIVPDQEYLIKPSPITTSDTTPTALLTLNTSAVIPNDQDDVRLTASIRAVAGNARGWIKIDSMVKNIGGTIGVVGTSTDFTTIRDGALAAINATVTTDGSGKIFVNVIGVTASVTWSGEVSFRVN